MLPRPAPAPHGLGRTTEPDFRRRPCGAVVGLVTNDTDPAGQGRVRVRFPWLSDGEESHWARVAQPYAGPGRGTFWLPEVGDEVAVVFDRGDPNHPYVLGGLWNGQDPPPPPGNPDGENHHKVWQTRAGHRLAFDDTPGGERITLEDGARQRRLVIDVAADTITLSAAPGDITFEAPQNTLTVGCRTLEIAATGTSTWRVGRDLTERSETREETVTGADRVQVETTWTLSAPTTTASASQSAITAQTLAVSVSGALILGNAGARTFESKKIQRTSGPETLVAPLLTVRAGEAALVANGPIALTGVVQIAAKEAVLVTPGALTLNGGAVNVKGHAGVSASAQLVKLG